jgi:uncharacterized membrane protein (UPF0182 family)
LSLDEMPDELRQHLRYPEDLFRVQTDIYSKYQIAPDDFFQRIGAWSVAQAPSVDRQDDSGLGSAASANSVETEFASESNVQRFVPYYSLFEGANGADEFVILRPFVPFSTDDARTELQAYMTASSDPESYGQLISYVLDQDQLPDGPVRVADQAESDSVISPDLTLLANEETGTRVRFGDLQPIPVADGLMYIRPVYVISSNVTEFRQVIVSHNSRSVMSSTLDAALAELFPGFEGNVGERLADADEPLDDGATDDGATDDDATDDGATADDPADADTPVVVELSDDAAELVAQAEQLYQEAQELLRNGDLGGYQDRIDQMGEVLTALAEALPADG